MAYRLRSVCLHKSHVASNIAILSFYHSAICEVVSILRLARKFGHFHPKVVRNMRGAFLPQMGWTAPSGINVPKCGS